MSRKRHFSKCA